MEKFPFSEVGFLALQEELYQLTDNALQVEAQAIKNAFTDWLPNHLEMSTSQLLFLNNMDQRTLVFMADQTSFAVANRLPVSLAKEDPPTKSDDQGKIVYTKSSLSASDGKTLGFVASGDLHFKITY